MEEILKLAISNGIFAALFVFLFFYQLRDSYSREKKYQNTIEKLAKHLDDIEEVKISAKALEKGVSSVDKKVSDVKLVLAKKGEKK